jgi:hypothetical protein
VRAYGPDPSAQKAYIRVPAAEQEPPSSRSCDGGGIGARA